MKKIILAFFVVFFILKVNIIVSQTFSFSSQIIPDHSPKFHWKFTNNDSLLTDSSYIEIMEFDENYAPLDSKKIDVTSIKDTNGSITFYYDCNYVFQFTTKSGYTLITPVSFLSIGKQYGSQQSYKYRTVQNTVTLCEYKCIVNLEKEVNYTILKSKIINYLQKNGFYIAKNSGNNLFSWILTNTIISADVCNPANDDCNVAIENRNIIYQIGILVNLIKETSSGKYNIEMCPFVKANCRKCSDDFAYVPLSNLKSQVSQKLQEKIMAYSNNLKIEIDNDK